MKHKLGRLKAGEKNVMSLSAASLSASQSDGWMEGWRDEWMVVSLLCYGRQRKRRRVTERKQRRQSISDIRNHMTKVCLHWARSTYAACWVRDCIVFAGLCLSLAFYVINVQNAWSVQTEKHSNKSKNIDSTSGYGQYYFYIITEWQHGEQAHEQCNTFFYPHRNPVCRRSFQMNGDIFNVFSVISPWAHV